MKNKKDKYVDSWIKFFSNRLFAVGIVAVCAFFAIGEGNSNFHLSILMIMFIAPVISSLCQENRRLSLRLEEIEEKMQKYETEPSLYLDPDECLDKNR
jgi:hypothetical protein